MNIKSPLGETLLLLTLSVAAKVLLLQLLQLCLVLLLTQLCCCYYHGCLLASRAQPMHLLGPKDTRLIVS